MIDSLRTSMASDSLITALAIDPDPPALAEWKWPPLPPHYSYELAIAARVDSDLTRRTLTIDYENLPSQMIDWEGLDVVVIANDSPFRDVAAMTAMKRWLAAGGRAWVMLDLVSPENLRWLLSDGMACQKLDDVDLNRFVVEHEMISPLADADRTVESETPIRLRRVTQVGGEVTHEVDGFLQRFGMRSAKVGCWLPRWALLRGSRRVAVSASLAMIMRPTFRCAFGHNRFRIVCTNIGRLLRRLILPTCCIPFGILVIRYWTGALC